MSPGRAKFAAVPLALLCGLLLWLLPGAATAQGPEVDRVVVRKAERRLTETALKDLKVRVEG